MRRVLLAGAMGVLLAAAAVAVESWRRSSSHSDAEALCESIPAGSSRAQVQALASRESERSSSGMGDDLKLYVAGGCFCRVRFNAEAVASALAICNN